jgi:hypothetical protein
MKLRLKPAAVYISFFISISICFGESYDDLIKITKDQFKISGITIGTKRDEVVKIFGNPDSSISVPDEVVDDSGETLSYEGLEIYVAANKVYNIKCKNKKYSTADSIKVGDSIEKVFKTYGKTDIIKRNEQDMICYWLIKSDCQLIFHIRNKKVYLIHFWMDYV